MRVIALLLLVLAGVSLAVTQSSAQSSAQSAADANRFSPPLNPGNFVPLGVSGASAWYLDLSSRRVVVCTKGSGAPTCETAPMPG